MLKLHGGVLPSSRLRNACLPYPTPHHGNLTLARHAPRLRLPPLASASAGGCPGLLGHSRAPQAMMLKYDAKAERHQARRLEAEQAGEGAQLEK